MDENNGRKKKVDITNLVTGRFNEDKLLLNIEEREIGQMSLGGQGTPPQFQFEEGFGIENNKIYQIQEEGVNDDQYVQGCDMGWC